MHFNKIMEYRSIYPDLKVSANLQWPFRCRVRHHDHSISFVAVGIAIIIMWLNRYDFFPINVLTVTMQ